METLGVKSSYGQQRMIVIGKVKYDAFGRDEETYTNGSGLTVRTTQYPKPNEPINTYFLYDPINQLIEVTDAMGKKTISVYDKAGRRISVTHPASDTTTFEYDEGSNLIAKQTANLRQAGAGKKIRYTYTFNRPDSIIYPDHPENNVIYSYGSASNSSGFNLKGRLVSLTDGSGRQEFKYGRQGELTELSRTLVIPNQSVATYTTRWNYDSWNRLLKMTYPDGEEVNYDYNTYKPDNRLLNTLSVQKGSAVLMNNTYTYDAVQNVTGIVNSGVPGNTIGGNMTHNYFYDKLYRLDSASGDFIGDNGKKARYNLSMRYDNLHNITRKKQDIVQNGIKFGGILNAGYDLSYNYSDNSQQIANIADQSYRVERSSQATYQTGSQAGDAISSKAQTFTYDANGNMTFVATGKMLTDSTLQATTSRQMLWDEENRLLAISDNGYVSNYWYDAAGERTVKESFDSEGVFINGVLSGARTGTGKFTAYVSPYLVVNNGGYYSKHIYMGSQRITSKFGSSEIFHDSVNPIAPANPHNLAMAAKLSTQNAMIQNRFDSLGVVYRGTSQGSAGLITSLAGRIASPQLYFYHPDHLGSSSLITDGNGTLVQHLEYLPFGEVFVEENKSTWSTPYKFSAKELDGETGLYYFGARYYDARLGVWLSVDPLAEKFVGRSSYEYTLSNPVRFVDPDGRSTDVTRNSNGTYTVVYAVNDKDNNIYVQGHDGKRTNEIIGTTLKPTDFMLTNDETGEFFGHANITFSLDNLTVSGSVHPNSSTTSTINNANVQDLIQWGKELYNAELNQRCPMTFYGALEVLKDMSSNFDPANTSNGHGSLDFKSSLGLDKYTAIGFGISANGKPIITTLRAVGNINFGANMRSTKPFLLGSTTWYYSKVMEQVGAYNQSQNNGRGYNSGFPFFGEHTYSGNYIYFGYFGFFYKK